MSDGKVSGSSNTKSKSRRLPGRSDDILGGMFKCASRMMKTSS
jgi:hypothetical protein